MKQFILFCSALFLITSAVVLTSYKTVDVESKWSDSTAVMQVLIDLGEKAPSHYRGNASAEEIEKGSNFIHNGIALSPEGKKSKFISRHFMCTSCHNTKREDEDLVNINQDARLKYADKNKIGYLQGSTFWGIVNRESWYNDDYYKKYGELVDAARSSLVGSIQLCATSCAQGRELEEWEVESILAYYSSLELKMADLGLADEDWKKLNKLASKKETYPDAIAFIKAKYSQNSPATFLDPPKDKKAGYGMTGRPEMGKMIYNRGCQHCHRPMGESDVILSDGKSSFTWLKKHMFDNTQLSIYEIIRHGTYAEFGHRPYMPHYTLQKMSDQQVEDLRAFIEQEAGK